MSNSKKHSPAELLHNPELPLDANSRAALSEEDLRTAERQRRLDHNLQSAMQELHAHLDARQPDWASFETRLKNVIQTEAEASPETDFLRRMQVRERLAWLKEKLVFSEQSGLRWAAAAALFAVVIAPVAFQYGGASTPSLASGDSASSAEALADAGPAQQEERTTGRAPWAGAPPAPPLPPESESDAADSGASGERAAASAPAADAAASLSKQERAMLQVQLNVLRDKLESAETDAERLRLLRQLEQLYSRDPDARSKELKAVRQALEELR